MFRDCVKREFYETFQTYMPENDGHLARETLQIGAIPDNELITESNLAYCTTLRMQ